MNLWTEFEGVTIDSAFALTKLVQTEGRSAFFSTRNANGESVLIRIIECHFDEGEILARWRGVQTLGHPNFLRIDRFGQFRIVAEDTTAVYAVFERVEANLGDVLQRGRLSAADASQIGLSVCSALETLHASGFVHEHVETRNIYAVGDKVKLRSDCVRETPEGVAGMEARRHDVHDLAVVLAQVLLGAPSGSAVASQPLPAAPFDEIVGNGMNGSWGLAEIREALARRDLPKAARQKVVPANLPVTMETPSAAQAASSKTGDWSAMPLPFDSTAKPEPKRERSAFPASNSAKHSGLPGQKPEPLELPVIFGISERDFRKWRTAGALLLGVVFLGWMMLHWLGHRADAGAPQQASTQAEGSPQVIVKRSAADPSLAAPAQKRGAQSRRVGWRVVAFTYNQRDQAQKKAASLAQQHPDLSPVIFSPTGKAPWLVTIGGVLQRDAAYGLARRARSLGLPRDTYAQNYTLR